MKAYYLPILCLILLQACGSKDCEKHFAFEFPMSVTPRDTFDIGDTIWHEMQLPEKLLDKNSGEHIDIKDFNLYFEIAVSRWDSNTIVEGTLNFDIIQDIGTVTQGTNIFTFTYIEFESLANKYFRYGLVPKVAGKFSEGVELPLALYDKENLSLQDPERFRLTDSPCAQFMVKDSGVKVNNGSINYYLLDGVCLPATFSNDTFCMQSYNQAANGGAYLFVVR